jgi:hypothetical protein
MNYLTRTLPLLALILLVSCGGKDPTSVGDTLQTGSNGVILSGGTFARTAINFTDSTAVAIFDSSKNRTAYTASGSAVFAKRVAGTPREVLASLTFPGDNTGTFQWDDLTAQASGTGLTLTIDSVVYKAVSGQTNVAEYANVGGAVSGTFSGSLKNSSTGEVITIESAKFSAKRGPDKKGQTSASDATIFTINGDGYSNEVIHMPGGDGSYTADHNAVNKYVTLMLLSSHVDIPGHGSPAVSWIIHYPAITTGVQLWNTKANSDVLLRIGDAVYSGMQGTTTISTLGTTLGTAVRGSFKGSMQNTDTKAVIQITGGEFAAVHF